MLSIVANCPGFLVYSDISPCSSVGQSYIVSSASMIVDVKGALQLKL